MPTVPQGPFEGSEYHRWTTSREDDDSIPAFMAGDPDKPLPVLRASIGGSEEIGFYLTFRGDPKQIAEMLDMASQLANEVAAGRVSYKDNRTKR